MGRGSGRVIDLRGLQSSFFLSAIVTLALTGVSNGIEDRENRRCCIGEPEVVFARELLFGLFIAPSIAPTAGLAVTLLCRELRVGVCGVPIVGECG